MRSRAVRPVTERLIPIAPFFPTIAQLNCGCMKCNFYEHCQLPNPASKLFAREHTVVLDDLIEMLDTRADELKPVIPNMFKSG